MSGPHQTRRLWFRVRIWGLAGLGACLKPEIRPTRVPTMAKIAGQNDIDPESNAVSHRNSSILVRESANKVWSAHFRR